METTEPLAGHVIRRPRIEDAAQIHELVAACDTRVLGRPDTTLDDIADELGEPGFDRDLDGWLVHDLDGALAGWGWACRKGAGDIVDIDVVTRPDVPEVTAWLWETVTERGRRIAAGLGHPGVRLDIGLYRGDHGKRAVAAAHGFAPATSFHRLRADHEGPAAAKAAILPGVTFHQGLTEEVRRQAHLVKQRGFAGHFGFAPLPYDEWCAELVSSSSHDWAQLLLARVHGAPAGMLLGTDHFAADDNCGYVRNIAVLPAFRGRGLGRALLLRAFAADAGRGRVGTYLHVDAGNSTPALALYLSAGMREVLVIDVWRKTL
ncbi:GNAT family N-acetyltransferase [Streptosporangium sp. KLBMP 9127]|nr:GNAT family N-acetyltransferase [Streptosporangium sp. KLBMP 9127]